MAKVLGRYKNGNYDVTILTDGTKIRETEEDNFIPSFAENCDVKITDYCDGGCEWCYEGCSTKGKDADLLSQKWVDTLHPYTELALNGNTLKHPQLLPFLQKLHDKKIIANITVSQKHFMKNLDFLHDLTDKQLIWGLGISLESPTPKFIEEVQKFPNAVIHTINGVLTGPQICGIVHRNLKILILGYKQLNRGADFLKDHAQTVQTNQFVLKKLLPALINNKSFKAISFDNLAIEQLEVKKLMSEKEWNEFYMGDDGSHTFYIDMVGGTFSKNSITSNDKRYPIMDNVDDMFKYIREGH